MKHSSLMKVAGVGALALTLAACSGGGAPAPSASETEAAPQGGGELVIWMDQNRNDALADVIASFEEETGTTVEVVVKDFADIDDDLTTQAPSGEGPDVVVGAHDWIGKLVTNGVIDPVELGDIAGDFEEVSIQAMTYNGATYGVPVSIENIALVRNTDLAPEAPASWDELVSTGEAAVESGDAEFPLLVGIDPNNADPYHLYPLQASYGGPVFGMNEDGSYNPTTCSSATRATSSSPARSPSGASRASSTSTSRRTSRRSSSRTAPRRTRSRAPGTSPRSRTLA